MHKPITRLFLSATLYLLIIIQIIQGQNQSVVSIFDDFLAKKWTGHYMNSEDSNIVHYIKWEVILDESVIKETKSVPDVNFEMFTYIYNDHENKSTSFFSIDNRGNSGKGTINEKDGQIIYMGKHFYEGGVSEFKKSFMINPDGQLVDLFYRRKQAEWIQGHWIQYNPDL